MAIWLRLVVLCFCVASILAAVTEGQRDPPPQVCTVGDRQPDTTDCHKYTECVDGVWKTEKCFWFRKFDSVSKRCVMWGAKCA